MLQPTSFHLDILGGTMQLLEPVRGKFLCRTLGGPTMEGEGPAGSAGVGISREEGLATRKGSSLLLRRPRPQVESDKNRVGVGGREMLWS